ncbi:anthranilate synthase component II [Candidatus Methanocrinis natronophilus]|uniref:anthranilate synthase n=1 Tax=Candidatus Methanocrinis natronophilus TaxID=3033396 RepID=A0ABT5X990_9EURY|nr:aminodeoxychorismate/anthranilate synthase component II [Candidatus Methanocrinis natronophilus]MDF0591147.1 aminodeoxychorismate/anthranilate synthase component II [Candidatus Methanocrinis natronophilus]
MTGKTILFIDNQDSFVWNLVDYVSQFHPETEVASNRIEPSRVKEIDPLGIVISPGPGNPANPRDIGRSIDVMRRFQGTPILGVCLGHQAINIAYGGTIERTDPVHGKASEVFHDGLGIFRGLKSPLRGGRYHSLAVETLGPPLMVTATTAEGVVMGIRHRYLPVEGVQFHPESVLTPEGKRLIANWLEGLIR